MAELTAIIGRYRPLVNGAHVGDAAAPPLLGARYLPPGFAPPQVVMELLRLSTMSPCARCKSWLYCKGLYLGLRPRTSILSLLAHSLQMTNCTAIQII
jgi:hypothetical protein